MNYEQDFRRLLVKNRWGWNCPWKGCTWTRFVVAYPNITIDVMFQFVSSLEWNKEILIIRNLWQSLLCQSRKALLLKRLTRLPNKAAPSRHGTPSVVSMIYIPTHTYSHNFTFGKTKQRSDCIFLLFVMKRQSSDTAYKCNTAIFLLH